MPAARLHLAAYLPRSRANGPGLRSVAWVQGCPFRCPGCFNPDFWPFTGGQQVTVEALAGWILAEPATEGVSFSGGEPFAQAAALAQLAERVRDGGKGVLVFSGFPAAALEASSHPGFRRLLAAADLLVAGPYERDRPCRHPLLASANQELVYVTQRYRGLDLGPRRVEYRIGAGGKMTVTGFPATVPGALEG
jgi:anaerobic ribonucleoside-triphosphate reductase activating protein